MDDLKNKIALVTGGGRGIGRAIALALAKEGADVAIVYNTDLASAEATATEIKALGQRAVAIQCNVALWGDVVKTAERIVGEWGGIDILINNAGGGTAVMVENMDKSEWDRVVGANLDGTFNCSRAVIEPMRKRGGGNIVNISSMAGRRIGFMDGPHYTAAKAGVIGFTRHLAFELGPSNIRVNALCPGTVITPAIERRFGSELLERIRSQVPLRRLPVSEDIADVVIFLLSDKSRAITGTIIDVDCGQTLGRVDWETYIRTREHR